MKAALPDNDTARLEALSLYKIPDTERKEAFDDITRLAAQICQTPIALMTLIDNDREWLQSAFGVSIAETACELDFWLHAIQQNEVLVVQDALADERFATNPLVTSDPRIRFFAGVPLISSGGYALGRLCVIDYVPRVLQAQQLEALQALSRQVIIQLELRRNSADLAHAMQESKQLEAKLYCREQEVLDLLENGIVGLHCVDANGIILWANKSELELLGYTRDEYIGRHIANFHADKAVIDDILQKLSANEILQNYEARLLCKDGSLRNVLINSNARWEDGKFSHTRCFTTDITERKRAQEERDRFFTLSLDMQCIAGFDAYFKRLNPAFEKTLLYTNEELQSRPFLDFVHPEDQALTLAEVEKLISGEPTIYFENRYRARDHSYKWLAWTAFPAIEEGLIYAIARDISALKQAELERKQAEEALRKSEERFRNLVETTSDCVWEVDENAVYTYVSPKVRDILGYEPEELLGKTSFDFMPREEAARVAKILEPLAAQALPFSCVETINIHKSGHLVVLETSGVPFFDSEGNFQGYRGMDRDITGRNSVEEELRDLGAALENAVEGISRLDTQGRYLAVNRAYANAVGYEPEEMIGMEWQMTVHPEDGQKLRVAYLQMLDFGKAEAEARGVRKDRSIFYKQVVMIAAYDGQERFIGHHCFMKDITERKQAEHKISEQAALLDVSTEAIFVRDLDNQILFWNKGAERLYGWKAEEVLGTNASEILYRETTPQHKEIQKILAETGEWQGELRKVTKDGKEIIVASHWTMVRDLDGQPKSILVVNTDITEKKQLEAQFLRAQRMESIGTLAGGIAHDLNNVLAPILMAVQLLQLKLPDERCQQWLTILETSARRGADLVKQVVSFARGIEGDRTIIEIRHIISEIRQIIRETFPKSIAVDIDIPQELWTVAGDTTQLHQVFMNLCVNARDALADGGTLKIYAENLVIDEHYARINIDAKVGPYIVVSVSDTGTGMPAETLDRIFEPFFTTKELGQGTGLGLSTVIAIIRSHGGFVNVYSEMGQGTEFKVYLPAVEESQTLSIEDIELSRGHGELILVVDDELAIRKITQSSLETNDYRVITADDGIEAIALYAQHKEEISLVLIDMMMPEMDGPTTIRTLRKIEPQVKIVAVSGLVSNDKLAQARCFGVKTFLSKPYTTKELLNTIDGVLSTN